MPHVVTPFNRKRNKAEQTNSHPRHRRDGYFDEHDQWHDSSEATDTATTAEA